MINYSKINILKVLFVLSIPIIHSCGGKSCIKLDYLDEGDFETDDQMPGPITKGIEWPFNSEYFGIYPSSYEDDTLSIMRKTTVRRNGEPYTGCVTRGKDTYSFEDGLPVSCLLYEDPWENPKKEENFKDGIPHGKFISRTAQYYDDKNGERVELKDSLILWLERSYFNGLRNGEWISYDCNPGFIYTKDIGKNWIRTKSYWDMGKKVGTWIENTYTGQNEAGDMSGIKLDSYTETVYYRNQKHYEIKFEADGKFVECRIYGEWDSGRYGIPHYFRLKDFPDYDGYGSLEFLDKYIEEGKTQIDELIGEDGLVKK